LLAVVALVVAVVVAGGVAGAADASCPTAAFSLGAAGTGVPVREEGFEEPLKARETRLRPLRARLLSVSTAPACLL